MTAAAKSVFYFGIYLYLVGLQLLFVPGFFLKTFGLGEVHDVWIRVVGLLALLLGFYYTQCARKNIAGFYALTIPTRVTVFAVFLIFVLLNLAPPVLAALGAVDLAGAVWTWTALKKGRQAA